MKKVSPPKESSEENKAMAFQYMNVMDVMDGAQEMPLMVTKKKPYRQLNDKLVVSRLSNTQCNLPNI